MKRLKKLFGKSDPKEEELIAEKSENKEVKVNFLLPREVYLVKEAHRSLCSTNMTT